MSMRSGRPRAPPARAATRDSPEHEAETEVKPEDGRLESLDDEEQRLEQRLASVRREKARLAATRKVSATPPLDYLADARDRTASSVKREQSRSPVKRERVESAALARVPSATSSSSSTPAPALVSPGHGGVDAPIDLDDTEDDEAGAVREELAGAAKREEDLPHDEIERRRRREMTLDTVIDGKPCQLGLDVSAARFLNLDGGDVRAHVGPDVPLPAGHLPLLLRRDLIAKVCGGGNCGTTPPTTQLGEAYAPRYISMDLHWNPTMVAKAGAHGFMLRVNDLDIVADEQRRPFPVFLQLDANQFLYLGCYATTTCRGRLDKAALRRIHAHTPTIIERWVKGFVKYRKFEAALKYRPEGDGVPAKYRRPLWSGSGAKPSEERVRQAMLDVDDPRACIYYHLLRCVAYDQDLADRLVARHEEYFASPSGRTWLASDSGRTWRRSDAVKPFQAFLDGLGLGAVSDDDDEHEDVAKEESPGPERSSKRRRI